MDSPARSASAGSASDNTNLRSAMLRETELFGLPLPWLVLAGLVYPAAVLAGWWYARRAERAEREFAELVDRT